MASQQGKWLPKETVLAIYVYYMYMYDRTGIRGLQIECCRGAYGSYFVIAPGVTLKLCITFRSNNSICFSRRLYFIVLSLFNRVPALNDLQLEWQHVTHTDNNKVRIIYFIIKFDKKCGYFIIYYGQQRMFTWDESCF